jgi:hypothetical protein
VLRLTGSFVLQLPHLAPITITSLDWSTTAPAAIDFSQPFLYNLEAILRNYFTNNLVEILARIYTNLLDLAAYLIRLLRSGNAMEAAALTEHDLIAGFAAVEKRVVEIAMG